MLDSQVLHLAEIDEVKERLARLASTLAMINSMMDSGGMEDTTAIVMSEINKGRARLAELRSLI